MASAFHLGQTDQLFVRYGGAQKGAAIEKQRLSNWIVEVITMAYKKTQKPLPGAVSCHFTRAVSASWAAFRGVSIVDICASATWTSPSTFVHFYKLNVAQLPLMLSAQRFFILNFCQWVLFPMTMLVGVFQ